MRLALLLHAAAATYREDLCERDTKLKTDATSKKVALVLRGEAFRGLSYGISPSVGRFRRGKTAFSCTAVSHRIQRALSASHVAHLVAPLEAAGLEVDVYLATYGCGGVTSDKEAAIALRHLSKWYERNSTRTRVKRAEALDRAGATQSTPVNVAMGWLRDGWPAGGYRSVLIWRFDMPALAPMGRRQADPGGEAAECRPSVGRACPSVGLPPKAPRAECDPALDTNSSAKRRPMNCWCHPYDACHSKGGYDEYASRLDEAYYKYEDDWAFSFPGRLARCAVPVFETDCLNMKRPIMSHECNFRLARTGPAVSGAELDARRASPRRASRASFTSFEARPLVRSRGASDRPGAQHGPETVDRVPERLQFAGWGHLPPAAGPLRRPAVPRGRAGGPERGLPAVRARAPRQDGGRGQGQRTGEATCLEPIQVRRLRRGGLRGGVVVAGPLHAAGAGLRPRRVPEAAGVSGSARVCAEARADGRRA
mmetsp:Transcript_13529/g.41854  ORF Transcript_13529/g.41854 Transcript_13529/m.41854 type:complete len:482 (-) Transcript_13529:65-1510(-)